MNKNSSTDIGCVFLVILLLAAVWVILTGDVGAVGF